MVFNKCPSQDFICIKIGEVVITWHLHYRLDRKT